MDLSDNDLQKLLAEQAIGTENKETYDRMIKPFFDEREALLFQAFSESNTNDRDQLLLIKLQLNALKSMNQHFIHFINTGKMAEMALAENKQDEENNDDN